MSHMHSYVEIPKCLRSKTARAATLLATLLAASAAWGQKIDVQFDASADFSKYKTFVVRNGSLNSRNPALNSELVQKQIEADIRNDLTTRGLTEATGGAADLNVFYHFGSQRKAELEAFPPDGVAGARAGLGCRTLRARW